jgi:hypothetical protein
MAAVFLRRGPWGWIQSEAAARDGVATGAHAEIDSLDELPAALVALRGPG